jgi:hypothetical protein
MPRHRHTWVWKERRTDIFGKVRDIYACACGAVDERPV